LHKKLPTKVAVSFDPSEKKALSHSSGSRAYPMMGSPKGGSICPRPKCLFLSKYKKEHVKLAETLSGKVDHDSFVSSAFAGKRPEGVSAQNDDPPCGGNDLVKCALSIFQEYDDFENKTCIYSTPKSGKSGKALLSKSKIERFQVESSLVAQNFAPATIHDGKMYSPGIANPYGVFQATNRVFIETLINLLILEDYLTCAGTKIENLLTIKFYNTVAGDPDFLFFAYLALIIWWVSRGNVVFPGMEEDLALLLPTVIFVPTPDLGANAVIMVVQEHSHTVTSHASNITLHSGIKYMLHYIG